MIFATISLVIFVDIIIAARDCIIGDLLGSLYFDFRWKSAKYGADYSFYQEMVAYDRYNVYKPSSCNICLGEYADEIVPQQKSLLKCGHLYHTACLHNNEHYNWNHAGWPYGVSKCPSCRSQYHAFSQKFDYNENYQRNLPYRYQKIKFPGQDFMDKMIWDKVVPEYREYCIKEWKYYPARWNMKLYIN